MTRTAVFFILAAGSAASAQVLLSTDFENGQTSGWSINGGTDITATGGNPGAFLHLPLMDFEWIDFRNETAAPLTGNLSRYGGPLRLAADVRVFALLDFDEQPMDPRLFPLVFQIADATDPTISVYFTGPGMPSVESGWVTYTFDIPDPTLTTLPAGWGGTGDEDALGNPRLPAGRTYASVLANVGSIHLTTAQPGYFYSANFWEVGFDNAVFSHVAPPCYANCDGSTATPVLNVSDFTCFLQKFAAGDLYANCDHGIDPPILNVADFTCFLQKFAAGCP